MRIKLISILILLMTFASACGGQTPQATPEPATATQTSIPPTNTPAPTNTPLPAPTDTSIPATEAAPAGISYTNDVAPIFEASCNKCHGIEQVKEGLDLTTFETLMAGSFNGSVITPGNANDSYLVQQVVTGEMPNRGTALSPEQIQIIIDWVNQGALNN